MEYRLTFLGRLKGAIGELYRHAVTVDAESSEAARLKLYDTHEHISLLTIARDATDQETVTHAAAQVNASRGVWPNKLGFDHRGWSYTVRAGEWNAISRRTGWFGQGLSPKLAQEAARAGKARKRGNLAVAELLKDAVQL
jgi:hypothetical protein